MSLPVSAAVIGMPTVEFLEHNVEVAKNFQPLPPDRMKQMADQLAGAYKASIDRFFANHRDA